MVNVYDQWFETKISDRRIKEKILECYEKKFRSVVKRNSGVL